MYLAQSASAARLTQKASPVAGHARPVAACKSKLMAHGRSASAVTVRAEDAPKSIGSDPSKMTVSLPAALNIDDIMERLPHRFPFLLVSPGRRAGPCLDV